MPDLLIGIGAFQSRASSARSLIPESGVSVGELRNWCVLVCASGVPGDTHTQPSPPPIQVPEAPCLRFPSVCLHAPIPTRVNPAREYVEVPCHRPARHSAVGAEASHP